MAVAVANGASFDDSKGSMKNLDRVQALSFNVEANRQQPTEVGSFGFVANQVMQSPDVNLEIEYLLSDGDNERNLGLYVNDGNNSGWKGIFSDMTLNNLDRVDDTLDFLVLGAGEGEDINFNPDFDDADILGFGNCYLNNYRLSMDVDSFPSVQISMVGSNMNFQKFDVNKSSDLPSVNSYLGKTRTEDDNHPSFGRFSSTSLNPDIIKPYRNGISVPAFSRGDVKITIYEDLTDGGERSIGGNKLIEYDKAHIQSLEMNMQFNRKDIRGFGRNFVGDRKIRYPVLSSMSMNLLPREFEQGELKDILTHDKAYSISMQFFYPYSRGITNIYAGDDILGYRKGAQDCSKENALVLGVIYKGAQLVSHNFDLNIGSNMTSSVSFEVDTTPNAKPFRGVYMCDGNLMLTREEIEITDLLNGLIKTEEGDENILI